ncbi:MAG: hypothetical protein EHM47_18175, partial [Ignavibacteriales bacterium]
EMKNYQEALSSLKKAEPALGNFWEYNYIYALSYYNLGMFAHAVTYAERSVNLNSSESLHYNLAGKIYLKLGDYIKAEKNFRKYLEIKKDVSTETYIFLAEACLNNSKTTEAMELFDRVLSADPDNKLALDGKRNAVLIQNKKQGS